MSNLEWVFSPIPPDGGEQGGDPGEHVFEQNLDTFVREVLQNSNDQQLVLTEPVRVRFDFFALDGDRKRAFLEAVGWTGLKPHLEGMVAAKWLASERIQRELKEIDGEPLRILRITDSNTKGLTGGEWESKTNFKSLCRDILTRNEAGEGHGGGSFGLGKAVLWAYSGIATVVFFSELSDPQPDGSRRLFGRSNLASHDTTDDRKWSGKGFFGKQEIPPHSESPAAVSVWESPDGVLEPLLFHDGLLDSGTSILIVDFDEPDNAHDRRLVEIAKDLRGSVSKWFWPSLVDGSLIVDVSVSDVDESWAETIEDPGEDWKPYVDAWRCPEDESVDTLESVNQVHRSEVSIDVPRRVKNLTGKAVPAGRSEAILRLIALTEDSDFSGQVALVRGSRMVTEYKSFPSSADRGFSVCGVLQAGEAAHGQPEEDNRRLEAFLRAAEPPAHDKWLHTTRRIKADYPDRGNGAVLKRLWDGITKQIRDATASGVPPNDKKPPRKLVGLLKISTTGGTDPTGVLTVIPNRRETEFEDGIWSTTGTVSNSRPDDGPWMVELGLKLLVDSGRDVWLSVDAAEVNGKTADLKVVERHTVVRASVSGGSADYRIRSAPEADFDGVLSEAAVLTVATLVKNPSSAKKKSPPPGEIGSAD
jgi:hypothetical protein